VLSFIYFSLTWAGISVFKAFCFFVWCRSGPAVLYQGWLLVRVQYPWWGGGGGQAGKEEGRGLYIYLKELTYTNYLLPYILLHYLLIYLLLVGEEEGKYCLCLRKGGRGEGEGENERVV